jgi:predicted dehydrogenase
MQKFGIIGLGSISGRHRANIKSVFPDAVIVCMSASGRDVMTTPDNCDLLVSNLEEMILAQPDFGIVASPSSMHLTHAQSFIESGITTLIEKPISNTALNADQICEVQSRHRTIAGVGYCLRFLPSYALMKNLLANKAVGTIQTVTVNVGQHIDNWRPGRDFRQTVSALRALGGGCLRELSHELDYCQELFGPLFPEWAHVRSSSTLQLDVEDVADIMLRGPSDVVIYIHLDFLQHSPKRDCVIVGETGTLKWDLLDNKITQADSTGIKTVYHAPEWDKNQIYVEEIVDLANGFPHATSPMATLREAASVLHLIEKIEEVSRRVSSEC